MAVKAIASLAIAVVLASLGTTFARPDLVLVSSEAVHHSALLVQPDTNFAQKATELKHVSELVLNLFNIDGTTGSALERRPPKALLTVVIGGLAPQMLNEADFPHLSAILGSSPKSYIEVIPEAREFDDMLKAAFTQNEMTLNGYIQSALHNQVQMKTRTISEFACSIFLGCETDSGNLEELALFMNAKFENQIISFQGSNGQLYQLDTSNKSVNYFLKETAMILATTFTNSDLFSPYFITLVWSTLQSVLDEHGVQSAIASACFSILDIVIPRSFELFRTSYPYRAEIALLLLPPSHGAYITEEIRQVLATIDGIHSHQTAFVELSENTPISIASVRKRLSAGLPSHFQILSLTNQNGFKADSNPALFQITLWVSIMLVVLVIISAGALCCGETRKDTLLYSKITPSNDKKNR